MVACLYRQNGCSGYVGEPKGKQMEWGNEDHEQQYHDKTDSANKFECCSDEQRNCRYEQRVDEDKLGEWIQSERGNKIYQQFTGRNEVDEQ